MSPLVSFCTLQFILTCFCLLLLYSWINLLCNPFDCFSTLTLTLRYSRCHNQLVQSLCCFHRHQQQQLQECRGGCLVHWTRATNHMTGSQKARVLSPSWYLWATRLSKQGKGESMQVPAKSPWRVVRIGAYGGHGVGRADYGISWSDYWDLWWSVLRQQDQWCL